MLISLRFARIAKQLCGIVYLRMSEVDCAGLLAGEELWEDATEAEYNSLMAIVSCESHESMVSQDDLTLKGATGIPRSLFNFLTFTKSDGSYLSADFMESNHRISCKFLEFILVGEDIPPVVKQLCTSPAQILPSVHSNKDELVVEVVEGPISEGLSLNIRSCEELISLETNMDSLILDSNEQMESGSTDKTCPPSSKIISLQTELSKVQHIKSEEEKSPTSPSRRFRLNFANISKHDRKATLKSSPEYNRSAPSLGAELENKFMDPEKCSNSEGNPGFHLHNAGKSNAGVFNEGSPLSGADQHSSLITLIYQKKTSKNLPKQTATPNESKASHKRNGKIFEEGIDSAIRNFGVDDPSLARNVKGNLSLNFQTSSTKMPDLNQPSIKCTTQTLKKNSNTVKNIKSTRLLGLKPIIASLTLRTKTSLKSREKVSDEHKSIKYPSPLAENTCSKHSKTSELFSPKILTYSPASLSSIPDSRLDIYP